MKSPYFAVFALAAGLQGMPVRADAGGPRAQTESIVLGGGCFWCVQGAFEVVPGVVATAAGYAGGSLANPSYEAVSSGTTGHAEVVQIEFDPSRISLARIFELYFEIHDPTTLDRQGADIGSQYRSIVLYSSDAQRRAAVEAIAVAQRGYGDPIVTELVPLERFWRAEEYHQDYFRKNPNAAYCRLVVAPKVRKAQAFSAELKLGATP